MTKIINSFVFFDLETTDLIRGKIMPKITELAMVAVLREHIKVPQSKLPRVLSKIVIPINPNASIAKIVTNMTDLSNHHLKNFKPFDSNVCGQIWYFLQRLEEPVCFVAHNGKRFDFPILLNEFKNCGESMPNEFLAIDSIDAFKHYFKEKQILQENQEMKETPKPINNSGDNCHSLLRDSWDDAVCSVLDTLETSESFEEITLLERTESFDECKDTYLNLQRTNDKTPELKIIKEESVSYVSHNNTVAKDSVFPKPKNFKLETIYTNMTGIPVDKAHYAENDCLTLIRCANLIGNDFIEFADNNAKPLTSYERQIEV